MVKTKKRFWHQGLQFDCHRCGNCCTFPGGSVYASENDFKKIAEFLEMDFNAFLKMFTFEHNGKVSLKSRPEGPCVFYENGCSVYGVRPTQCRTFPFWQEIMKSRTRWEMQSLMCAGINQGTSRSREEIAATLRENEIELMKWPFR